MARFGMVVSRVKSAAVAGPVKVVPPTRVTVTEARLSVAGVRARSADSVAP